MVHKHNWLRNTLRKAAAYLLANLTYCITLLVAPPLNTLTVSVLQKG